MFKPLAGATVGAVLLASSAWAAPLDLFTTYGNFGSNSTQTDAGFYVWSNDAGSLWSVRWYGDSDGASFSGNVTLTGLSLTSLTPVEVDFSLDPTNQEFVANGGSAITFIADNGSEWEGFDFSLDSIASSSLLSFSFSSDLFDIGNPSNSIFVGSSYFTPDVTVIDVNDGDSSSALFSVSFATEVPEPGSLLFLGFGLAALGLSRRKITS